MGRTGVLWGSTGYGAPMRLHTRSDGWAVHVAVEGELDLAAGVKLDQELRRVVEEGAHQIRLDLSDCTFVDSSGIGLLLRWREESEAQGRRFEVSGARGAVKRIFQVSGVLRD